jgi:hypothetical protein
MNHAVVRLSTSPFEIEKKFKLAQLPRSDDSSRNRQNIPTIDRQKRAFLA